MIIFKLHIPSFIDATRRPPSLYESIEEVLLLPQVQGYKKSKDFYQYSLKREEDGKEGYRRFLLMAEFNYGQKQYVVGFIHEVKDNPDGIPNGRFPTSTDTEKYNF